MALGYTKTVWVDDDGSGTVGTAYTAARMNNIENGIEDNILAHDAVSNSAAGTGTLEWTHTPNAAKPRGVLVLIVTNAATGGVTGVTYGGRNMTQVPGTPFNHAEGSEDGAISAYFIGTNVPLGAVTVKVSVTGANTRRAVAYTMTGPSDLTIQKPKTLDSANTKSPKVNITQAVNEPVLAYMAIHSGQDDPASLVIAEEGVSDLTHDFGTQSAAFQHLPLPIAASTSMGWTSSTEAPAGVLGLAVRPTIVYPAQGTVPGAENSAVGDRLNYVEETQGIAWEFVCVDPTATYPWRFIGGAPLYEEISAPEESASTTYVDLKTVGPAVTLPFGGDYDIEMGCGSWGTAGNAAVAMSMQIGATGAKDEDWVRGDDRPTASQEEKSVMRRYRKKALTAVTLTAKYRVGAGTGAWEKRWMSVTPVRVG